jgi:hypothetical protein
VPQKSNEEQGRAYGGKHHFAGVREETGLIVRAK